jgi:hypothetical protein
MGWEGFMQAEHKQLRERREGKLRRALGRPLSGESVEELDRIGEQDRLRAEQGLVALMGEGGDISYERLEDLDRLDMEARTAAEWVQVEWLRERVERRKRGAGPPPYPGTCVELPRESRF